MPIRRRKSLRLAPQNLQLSQHVSSGVLVGVLKPDDVVGGGRCLPVKIDSAGGGPGAVRVLLIGASSGGGLVLPKGGWETDETVEAAARRETVEEAGVRGDMEVTPAVRAPVHENECNSLFHGFRVVLFASTRPGAHTPLPRPSPPSPSPSLL